MNIRADYITTMMLRHSRWSGRHIMPTGPGWMASDQTGGVAACLVWNNMHHVQSPSAQEQHHNGKIVHITGHHQVNHTRTQCSLHLSKSKCGRIRMNDMTLTEWRHFPKACSWTWEWWLWGCVEKGGWWGGNGGGEWVKRDVGRGKWGVGGRERRWGRGSGEVGGGVGWG